MKRGLLARFFTSPPSPAVCLEQELEAAIARRANDRRTRIDNGEQRRFERARPKLEQLRREMATEPVEF